MLILGFGLFLSAGHFYCLLLVLAIKAGVFKEIIGLRRHYDREQGNLRLTELSFYLLFLASEAIVLATLLETRLPSLAQQLGL